LLASVDSDVRIVICAHLVQLQAQAANHLVAGHCKYSRNCGFISLVIKRRRFTSGRCSLRILLVASAMGREPRLQRATGIGSSFAEHVEPEGIQALRASDGRCGGRSCKTCRRVSVWPRCSGSLRDGCALLLASPVRDGGESGSDDTVRVEEVASERVELEGAQTLHARERRDGLGGRGGCNHGRWLGWLGCLVGDGGGSELRAEGLGSKLGRVFVHG
ncbi:hypothetical protein EXIGLDRAFT_799797, partial [Exidia glandulosa HHB12029]